MTGDQGTAGWTRRSVLAGTAGLAATSGCVARTRNVLGREPAEQLSLRILTVPPDANPFPIQIARRLAHNLSACGIDARVEPADTEAVYRRVLINHDFDVYVGQFHQAVGQDPDYLYSLLHSVYASEPGWQNPFGYTDLGLDEDLETQRTNGGARRRTAVASIQEKVAEAQPFTPVAFVDSLSTVRDDRFAGWGDDPADPLTLLGLTSNGETDTLGLATTDGRITENRNPLAAEFRSVGSVLDLLYDPLGRWIDGVVRPWLADGWQFRARPGPVAEIELREGLTWHDGEPLTAEDVAFTYRFLADTSLGEADSPIPASRFRGRVSLVESAEAVDERTVRLAFVDAITPVAERALTVPILPAHVWRERTDTARIAGVDTNRPVTDALVSSNADPVGSGPLRFERAVPGESLRLSRFEDHFLRNTDAADLPDRVVGGPAYREVRVRSVGSDDAAVELVAGGDADATISPLGPGVVPRIGREADLQLVSAPARSFYHIGYNTRTAPLSNTRFRRVVARTLDKESVVEDVFDGYATPAASPLATTGWLAESLRWEGADPAAPFIGTDGELDESTAREAFESAGYRYDEGELVDG